MVLVSLVWAVVPQMSNSYRLLKSVNEIKFYTLYMAPLVAGPVNTAITANTNIVPQSYN